MSRDNFDNGMIGMPYESMITSVGKTNHESNARGKRNKRESFLLQN